MTIYKLEDSIVPEVATVEEAKVKAQPGQNYTVSRDLKPLSYGSVRGRVTDLAGKPLAGGSIYLSRELSSSDGSGELYPLTTTDKAGRFSLARVAPFDDYTVMCVLNAEALVYSGPNGEVAQVRVRERETTSVSIRIDTIKPQILAPQAPRVVSGKVKLRYQASDNVGIADVYAGVDGTGLSDKGSDTHVDFGLKPPRQAQGVLGWEHAPRGQWSPSLEFGGV